MTAAVADLELDPGTPLLRGTVSMPIGLAA